MLFVKNFSELAPSYFLQIRCNTFQQQTRLKIHEITSIMSKLCFVPYTPTIAVSSCARNPDTFTNPEIKLL